MSSIEDILNAEDSEDESLEGTNVDLEGLLQSKDDLDLDEGDSMSYVLKSRPSKIDSILSISDEDLKESLPAVDIDVDDADHDQSAMANSVSQLGCLSLSNDDADTVVDDGKDTESLSHIANAELREQQFLAFGKKSSQSALQAKRSSSAMLGYSNVRCDELSIISSQLLRNANYKQHGPGSATCLVVGVVFIAVGTTKGLIILFDHEQEIRQVLGSNVPNGGRPSAPVSSLDVTRTFSSSSGGGKLLEGLLLCGYDSGEIALWDVAKGALLKVITDLHSSPVLVASILETISDGLSSLGAGDSALVPLPQGWYQHANAGATTKDHPGGKTDFASNFASAAVAGMQGVSVVAVTADKEGVMYKTRLSKSMWSATYASESECLLDASTGPLTGYAALPPLLRSIQTNGMVYLKNCSTTSSQCRVSCRYMVAHKSTRMLAINVGPSQTWIVQTHPKIKIVFKWDAPPASLTDDADPREGGNCANGFGKFMDWTWQAKGADGNDEQHVRPVVDAQSELEDGAVCADWMPVLARAWGSRIQLLSVLTVAIEGSGDAGGTQLRPTAVGASDSIAQSFQSNFSFLSGGASKVTSTEKDGTSAVPFKTKFAVTKEGSLVGQRVLSIRWVSSCELIVLTTTDVLVLNESLQLVEQLSLQPSASMELSRLFAHNVSVHQEDLVPLQHAVCGRMLFVVASETVLRVQMQSCFDLADRLISKGQWLEALALVLENARRSPAQLQHSGAELDRYIIRYVELAVKQSTLGSSFPSSTVTASTASAAAAQSKNHYHLVAGVCIEYCIASSRMDVLFTQVYSLFKSAQQHYIFLEALEPFVLAGEIRSLPPAVIAEFCESALRLHRLPSIERCVAYFEISHLDMNFITKFLYENRMYSSFLYVYSNGLDDFPGAFQIIFSFLLEASTSRQQDRLSEDIALDATDVAFKLLLFTSYSFDGKVFPRGLKMDTPHLSLSWDLLRLLTSKTLHPTPSVFSLQSTAEQARAAQALGNFPYLMKLSEVDADAVWQILQKGVQLAQEQVNLHLPAPSGSPRSPAPQLPAKPSGGIPFSAQGHSDIYDSLLGFSRRQDAEVFTDGRSRRTFFNLFLGLISSCRCSLSDDFIAETIAFAGQRPSAERKKWELTMVTIAEHQVRAVPSADRYMKMSTELSKNNFWLACAAAAAVAKLTGGDFNLLQSLHADKALEFYISFADGEVEHEEACLVFDYVVMVFRVVAKVPHAQERDSMHREFCGALLKVVAMLTTIDLPSARKVARAHLLGHVAQLIEHTAQSPKAQYQLLHALLSDERDDVLARTKILGESFGEKALLTYFALLATYEPGKVLDFLRTFEFHYPLDECLQICRQKGIPEAVSFLMERTGEVLDALIMLLKDFSVKLKQVRRDIDAQLRSEMAAQAAAAKANVRIASADGDSYLVSQVLSKQGSARADAAMRLPCFRVLESIIHCVADLCSRHCQPDQTGMWLTAFDHLLMERQTVRSGTMSSSGEVVVVLIGLMLQTLMSHIAGSPITPQDIIRRVTAQGNAAGIRLGEFKGMMLSMLTSNHQEVLLQRLMNDIIRADLCVLHRQKIANLRRYVYRSGETQAASTVAQEHGTDRWGDAGDASSAQFSSSDENVGPTNAFIESCRTKHQRLLALRRKSGTYKQLLTESQVHTGAAGSPSLLNSAPPAQAPSPAERSNREQRRPGSLDKKAIYRSHM